MFAHGSPTYDGSSSCFRRITSGGQYIAEIDGLRFIAIIAVLVYHIGMMTLIYTHHYGPPVDRLQAFIHWAIFNGGRGVPIFFAISGFILGVPFARQYLCGSRPVSLRQYFLRRATRLEPPYVLSQCIRLYPVMAAKGLSFIQILPHFLAGLLYLHLLVYRTLPMVQLVGWSLEIEIQFYILAPLLARLFFRESPLIRRTLLWGFLPLHGLLVYFVAGPHPGELGGPIGAVTYFNITILYWIRYFVAGIAVAELYVTVFPRLRNHWWWDVVSLPCWILPFTLTDTMWSFFGPFILMLAFIGAFKGILAPRFFRIPLVAVIGGMCYSLYLTHSLALQGFYVVYWRVFPHIHGFRDHFIGGVILILPLLIVVGAGFFLLIERPCMDKQWPSKFAAWTRARLVRSPATQSD